MGRPRILVHNPVSFMGGGEVGLLNVLRMLGAPAELDATVVVPGPGPLAERLRAAGVPVLELPLPASMARVGRTGSLLARSWRALRALPAVPGYLGRLRDLVERERPALLWSNGLKSHYLCAGCGAPVPLVCHVRDVLPGLRSLRLLLRRRARLVLANSRATAAALGLPEALVRVVPNEIDLAAWDRAAVGPLEPRVAAAVDGAEPLILSVGKLCRLKGFEVLIEAFGLMEEKRREEGARRGGALLIAGSEDYATQGGWLPVLERTAREAGVGARVRFLGEVRSVAPLMRRAAVVALASRSEGFGRVLLEAMASARPVVATRVGGIPELVREGLDGLLVAPDDPAGLACALERLLAEPAVAKTMGEQGRARAEEVFALDRVAPLVRAALGEVLGRG